MDLRLSVLEGELLETNEETLALERKLELLAFERLRVKPRDPSKLPYACEGEYQCLVSCLRGGDYARTCATYAVAVIVGDPPPLPTKVVEDYHPKRIARRKHYEQYCSVQGFVHKGRVLGDVVITYANKDVYSGPLVAERWLDHKGVSQAAGRSADHWGKWDLFDGTTYEGVTVDNHFDTSAVIGDFKVTYPLTAPLELAPDAAEDRLVSRATLHTPPSREIFEGRVVDGRRHGIGLYVYADGYTQHTHTHTRQRPSKTTLYIY